MKPYIILLGVATILALCFTPTVVQAASGSLEYIDISHYNERYEDFKKITQLAQSFEQIAMDMGESAKAILNTKQPDFECITYTFSNQGGVSSGFSEAYHLTGLSMDMGEKTDAMYVDEALDKNIGNLLESFSTLRKSINQNIGICSRSSQHAIVNSYGREFKDFIGKATPILETIKTRIDADVKKHNE